MRKYLIIILLLVAFPVASIAGNYAKYYNDVPARAGISLAEPDTPRIPDNIVNIADFGAVPDGITLNTEAFVSAIRALAKLGGGHLIIPAGIWLTGPIELKDRIDLHLERNAILLFTPDKSAHLKDGKVQPCISASKRTDISITGQGIIDGNGEWWRAVKRGKVSDVEWNDFKRMGGTEAEGGKLWYPFDLAGQPNIAPDHKTQERMRSHMIRLTDCERVMVQGVTIQNAPKFHLIPTRCKHVIIDGVTVRCPWNAQNGDGIDLSCCQDVLVVNCTVDVGDDGICLKAGGGPAALKYPPVARVLIRDNTVFHAHGGFVIGSEFSAGIEDIAVLDNCFCGTDTGLRFKSAPGRGGKTSRIRISNIYMTDIRDQAIVFETSYIDVPVGTAGKKDDVDGFIPEFTDIRICNVIARDVRIGIAAKGTIQMIHDISISDCTISCTEKLAELSGIEAFGEGTIKLTNVNLQKN